jgi:hypothetical protein
MRSRIRLFSVVAIFLALLATMLLAGTANAATSADFGAQAKAAGLTTAQAAGLQAEVDKYLAKTQGTQIAPNKIDLGGAILTVPVPGEGKARELTAAPGGPVILTACPFEDFCAYQLPNFGGAQINMFTCGVYSIPWVGNGSWDNNQTPGTRARFLNAARQVIFTTPGAHSIRLSYNWTPVFFVRNC